MRISTVQLRRLQFIIVLCCFLQSFQIWTLYDLTSKKDDEIQQHPKRSYDDICTLANNLDVESQHYSSYQLGLRFVILYYSYAIEKIFKVKVTKVNTSILRGKIKSFKGNTGYRKDLKKAIVTLAEGNTIDSSLDIK